MSQDFGIQSRIEDYGCIVYMLGRAGFIDKAFKFIKIMPIRSNAVSRLVSRLAKCLTPQRKD